MQKFLALDLFEGKIVHLKKGCYDALTCYSDDPLLFAEQQLQAGVSHFHIVDLSAARNPELPQTNLIEALLRLPAFFQVGGGIHQVSQAQQYYEWGAKRLILGTQALGDPHFLPALSRCLPNNALMVSLDLAPQGADWQIKTHAWRSAHPLPLAETISWLQDLGIVHCLCTDISRDGMLSGPNLYLYRQLHSQYPSIRWMASGGIRGDADLEALAKIPMNAAVVGTAFYEHKMHVTSLLSES